MNQLSSFAPHTTTGLGFVRTPLLPRPHVLLEPAARDALLTSAAADVRVQALCVRPSDVRLLTRLGRGNSSTAYACVVMGQTACVVKVPNWAAPASDDGALLPQYVDVDVSNETQRAQAFADYAAEGACMQRLLEPPSKQQLNEEEANETWTRARLEARLVEIGRAYDAHEGAAHIHRVLHVELDPAPGYPMLFSERCDCSLQDVIAWFGNADDAQRSYQALMDDLFKHDAFASEQAPAWRRLARQVLLAFDYVRSCGLVHFDIAPCNIFIVGTESLATCRYLLADFGGVTCAAAHDDWSQASVTGLQRALVALDDANQDIRARGRSLEESPVRYTLRGPRVRDWPGRYAALLRIFCSD